MLWMAQYLTSMACLALAFSRLAVGRKGEWLDWMDRMEVLLEEDTSRLINFLQLQ